MQIDWSAADGVPVQPANQFVAQATPNDHVLNLGFIAPPIVLTPDDQERVAAMKSIPVRVIARIQLTPGAMRELIGVLSKNLAIREKRKKEN